MRRSGRGRERDRRVGGRSHPLSPPRPVVVAAGDLAALLAFAVIGLRSHDRAVDLAGLARDWLPFALCYTGAALLARAWTRPGPVTLLRAWLAGVGGGVLVRAVALGRPLDGDQLQFLVVSLLVSLVLLGAWRATYAAVRRRSASG